MNSDAEKGNVIKYRQLALGFSDDHKRGPGHTALLSSPQFSSPPPRTITNTLSSVMTSITPPPSPTGGELRYRRPVHHPHGPPHGGGAARSARRLGGHYRRPPRHLDGLPLGRAGRRRHRLPPGRGDRVARAGQCGILVEPECGRAGR